MKTIEELTNEIKSQYIGHETECTLKEFAEALEEEGAADGHSYFAYIFGDEDLAYASYWSLSQEQKDFWNDLLDALEDYTFDITFDDDNDSNAMGFHSTYQYCLDYIKAYNGTNDGYFADYKGGTVSIYCHDTDRDVYQEEVR